MDGYGKRVLVIESDGVLGNSLSDLLELQGYAVNVVSSGLAGLAEMSKRRFDAVIADCHTSELNGLEFAMMCRTAWLETPIVFLCDEDDCGRKNWQFCGFTTRIHMPCKETLVLSVLRAAIQCTKVFHVASSPI